MRMSGGHPPGSWTPPAPLFARLPYPAPKISQIRTDVRDFLFLRIFHKTQRWHPCLKPLTRVPLSLVMKPNSTVYSSAPASPGCPTTSASDRCEHSPSKPVVSLFNHPVHLFGPVPYILAVVLYINGAILQVVRNI